MNERGGCGLITIITNIIFFILLMAVLGSCVNLFDSTP